MKLPKLRELSEFCTPTGPLFDKAKPVQFSLGGSVVQLSAPKHSTSLLGSEEIIPEPFYEIANMRGRTFNTSIIEDDSWRYFDIMGRSWSYSGPMFTGNIAEVSLWVTILIPTQIKSEVSLFHPRAFEQSVGDFITARYAKELTAGRADWIAPVNWQVLDTLPVVAATFDVMPDPATSNAGMIRKNVFFPVADQRLVMLEFVIAQYLPGTYEERDKLIDRAPMETLAKDIINSVRVTLCAEAEAQRDKALQGLNDTSLITTFPPMKWTTPEQDAEWDAHVAMMKKMQREMN